MRNVMCGTKWVGLAMLGVMAWAGAEARAVVLYDGRGLNGDPISAMNGPTWQWVYGQFPFVGTDNPVSVGVGTLLNTTTANAPAQAGFNSAHAGALAKPGMPVLDRNAGYTVEFQLMVLSETHASGNRAGFSIIVQSSDKKGIEIGFWEDNVWAYDFTGPSTFTKSLLPGEDGVVNTGDLRNYTLTVQGESYTFANGATTLLSGQLRDYSAFGFPYTTESWIFMGDDTTQGSSQTLITYVEVETNTAVPEPMSVGVLGLGLAGLLVRRRR